MADYSLVREQIREAIDVVALLEYYGAKVNEYNVKYDRVRSTCPIHGGDGENNFSFDTNSKLFTCFSKHCGENRNLPLGQQQARDIFYFIQLCEERRTGQHCSFFKALEIASRISGIALTPENLQVSKETRDKLEISKWIKQQNKLNKKIVLDALDECIVKLYKETSHPYLLSRNFSQEIIDTFELGYSPDGIDEDYNASKRDFPGRIIVPIRDDKGNLVGLSGRLATDDKLLIEKYKKYRHQLDFNKGYVLYNFHRAKQEINETNRIIIVEGFFDVMRIESFGATNVVATMGTSLIPEQLQLILSNCYEAYICYDGDSAGQLGAERIAEQLLQVSTDAYIIPMPKTKDPDNLTSLEFWNAYSEAKKFIPKPKTHLTTRRPKAII